MTPFHGGIFASPDIQQQLGNYRSIPLLNTDAFSLLTSPQAKADLKAKADAYAKASASKGGEGEGL